MEAVTSIFTSPGPSGAGSLTSLDTAGLPFKPPLAAHTGPSAPATLGGASHTKTPTTPLAVSSILMDLSVLPSFPALPTPPLAPLPCRERCPSRKGPGVSWILLPPLPPPHPTRGLQDSAPFTQGHQLTLVQIQSYLQGHGDISSGSP